MNRQQTSFEQLVFTPTEASTAYVEYAAQIQADIATGLCPTWGVPSMDAAIIPLKPGDVVGIIARPGHGKSSLAAYLAKRTAGMLADNGIEDRAVVYCTLEQTIEELEAFFQAGDEYTVTDLAWGRVDMDAVKRGAVSRMSLPLLTVGRSMTRRKRTPKITVDVMYQAIASIEDKWKAQPALVVIDYIQIVPIERNVKRMTQVAEAIVGTKELAARIGAPIVVCVQARRDVDVYDAKIPTAADAQWSSSIEQAADKLIGVWRPCLTEDDAMGEMITINKVPVKLTQNLFVAKLLKQRWAAAGQTFLLHFDPAAVKLADLELRNQPPVEF
jgi:replicative DNA helicase